MLFFYPLDFTFVCPVRAHSCRRNCRALRRCRRAPLSGPRPAARAQTEIIAFSDRAKEFAEIDTAVRARRATVAPARNCLASSGPGRCAARARPRRATGAHAPRARAPASAAQLVGVSIDSVFSHLAWVNTPRNKGGLGGINFPLVADVTKSISKDYGVLIEEGGDAGIALRCVIAGRLRHGAAPWIASRRACARIPLHAARLQHLARAAHAHRAPAAAGPAAGCAPGAIRPALTRVSLPHSGFRALPQRPLHHQRGGRAAPDHRERPAGGPLRGRGAAPGQGVQGARPRSARGGSVTGRVARARSLHAAPVAAGALCARRRRAPADAALCRCASAQHVDKHGEVCPAGWTPGAATMKADPKGSQEYFATVK